MVKQRTQASYHSPSAQSSPPAGFVEIRPGTAQRPGYNSFRHLCGCCSRWARQTTGGLCTPCLRRSVREGL